MNFFPISIVYKYQKKLRYTQLRFSWRTNSRNFWLLTSTRVLFSKIEIELRWGWLPMVIRMRRCDDWWYSDRIGVGWEFRQSRTEIGVRWWRPMKDEFISMPLITTHDNDLENRSNWSCTWKFDYQIVTLSGYCSILIWTY